MKIYSYIDGVNDESNEWEDRVNIQYDLIYVQLEN